MLKILDETAVRCPFCMTPISEESTQVTYDGITCFDGGRCQCGAVYAYDHSGHKLGQAYEDALYFACNGDIDRALSLVPDEEYKQAIINAPSGRPSLRRISQYGRAKWNKKTGVYYFIKIL
jgi:hypothetical protein